MIIDFHTHLFPRQIRENRSRFFDGEPAFELLYKPEKSKLSGGSDILAAMDEDGVDKSVVFGFPWEDEDLCRRHNDYILATADRRKDRLLGFCCFDVMGKSAPAEARRCLEAGAAGIGELALYRSGIDKEALDRLDPIMDAAMEFNVPVLIHTNEPVGHKYPGKTPVTHEQIWNMVSRFPKNKIVLAHWGGGIFFFHLLKKQAKELLENVYYDTAASPYLYDKRIYREACDIIGPEKVLFGSDFPLLRPMRYFKEVAGAGLTQEEADKILGLSAASLMGIKT
ncbi:MAG: amidohydrolase [Desulfatibacillum sp.]|nr:amidohydrolase [Desulfatibacillum sp.]